MTQRAFVRAGLVVAARAQAHEQPLQAHAQSRWLGPDDGDMDRERVTLLHLLVDRLRLLLRSPLRRRAHRMPPLDGLEGNSATGGDEEDVLDLQVTPEERERVYQVAGELADLLPSVSGVRGAARYQVADVDAQNLIAESALCPYGEAINPDPGLPVPHNVQLFVIRRSRRLAGFMPEYGKDALPPDRAPASRTNPLPGRPLPDRAARPSKRPQPSTAGVAPPHYPFKRIKVASTPSAPKRRAGVSTSDAQKPLRRKSMGPRRAFRRHNDAANSATTSSALPHPVAAASVAGTSTGPAPRPPDRLPSRFSSADASWPGPTSPFLFHASPPGPGSPLAPSSDLAPSSPTSARSVFEDPFPSSPVPSLSELGPPSSPAPTAHGPTELPASFHARAYPSLLLPNSLVDLANAPGAQERAEDEEPAPCYRFADFSMDDLKYSKPAVMPERPPVPQWTMPDPSTSSARPEHGAARRARYYAKQQLELQQPIADDDGGQSGPEIAIEKLNRTRPGWRGAVPHQLLRQLRRVWATPQLKELLQHITFLPYKGVNTAVSDTHGRMVLYRTTPISQHSAGMEAVVEDFASESYQFARMCPIKTGDRRHNKRGEHYACVAGHHRQYAQIPYETRFQREYAEQIDWYFRPQGPAARVTWADYLTRVIEARFPAIAQRMRNNHDWHKEKHGITPKFGLFWNYCVNTPSVEGGVRRVFCRPHVDAMNCAVLLCAVFTFWSKGAEWLGEEEWSWLVVWELGIAIQLPRGSFLLYPSALFFHFNVRIVKCPKGQHPTEQNSSELPKEDGQWIGGRGSSVWFTQSTMHSQTSERDESTGGMASYEEVARACFPILPGEGSEDELKPSKPGDESDDDISEQGFMSDGFSPMLLLPTASSPGPLNPRRFERACMGTPTSRHTDSADVAPHELVQRVRAIHGLGTGQSGDFT
ncbi:hypothetical protein AURDEDRAFT_131511 [Auricularia subglabra TFB-10046 SS5]|uniref:Uncharacterized protein n=1 Tax=Auricularia subglabra (strain TFB-10046 / SS5) TaxID=717982 RepID=J0CTW9_AURST|nr:hypothetical protein AURDEDRAFT_131511 [Auricularia subglabra TFB-10046 SS5]